MDKNLFAASIDFSRIVEWFRALSVVQWAIVVVSAVCFLYFIGSFFAKRTRKGKNGLCAVASIVYAYIALLIADGTYFLDSTKGYCLVGIVVLLYVTTFLFSKDKFHLTKVGAGVVAALIQTAVLVFATLLLLALFTLGDSIYKDDVYSPLPYYKFFQFVLFASSLVVQIIAKQNEDTPTSSDTRKAENSTQTVSGKSNATYVGTTSTDPGLNTYMTIRGTNDPVYYKNGQYVDGNGNAVPITHIED